MVVAAQKREQKLLEIPVAVTALSLEQLAGFGVVSAKNLAAFVPNLTMTYGVFVPQITLRGVSTRNRNPGDEVSIPTFIDGIYQPFAYAAFYEQDNLERMEVLRGPQGTLFGRNAIGGAINIVTRRPSEELKADLAARYGSFDEVRARAYVSGPLTDTLRADLAARHSRGGAYIDDILRGGGFGDMDSDSVRGRLLWSPGERTLELLGLPGQ